MVVERPAPHAPIDLSSRRVKAEIEQFFREATTRVAPKQTARADTVHGWYQAWARDRGLEPVTAAMFGRISATIDGVTKRETGRFVVYEGIAPAQKMKAAA